MAEDDFEGLLSALGQLAGAKTAHQLVLARLLIIALAADKKPLQAVKRLERDLMGDVAAVRVAADDVDGLSIRAETREELKAILQLVRDGLQQLGE